MRIRLLLIVTLLLLGSPGHQATVDGPLATVSVDPTRPLTTVAPTFMGFSHEWSGGQQLMGPASAPNPLYRQLASNLLAYGGGPLSVRIGGNSTDRTAPPEPGVVDPFAQLYADFGAQFILGVNLGGNDVSLADSQASAYLQAMPPGSVQAIEIGNEPDLYRNNGLRARGYAYADYARDFAAWRTAIAPLLPSGIGLMGPAWSSASSLKDLPAFLDQEGPNLSLISHHWYAGTQCNGRTNPSDFLLRPQSASSGASAVAASVQLAHQRGLPFRMGEMNSISCGGEAGVSDVFASALWATDSMFNFASIGVDGVNLHTGNGGGYALFTFAMANTDAGPAYSIGSIRPEYYGLLLFQQAAPGGSHLLPVSTATGANLTAWATLSADGLVRVTVINKDQSADGLVSITLTRDTPGAVTRLQAPSLDAKSGLTLGGQTFDSSADGTLQGTPTTETVLPTSGVYTFQVPPVSAALLTVP